MESNFYLKFKKSPIFKAVVLEKSPIFKWRKFEKNFSLAFSLLLFFLFFITNFSKPILGLSLLSFSFFLIALIKDLFFEQKIKNPERTGEIFDKIDFYLAKAIYRALRFSKSKKINSSVFLHFLLDEKNPKINFIFSRLFVPISELKKKLLEDKREEEEVEGLITELGEGKEKIKIGEILFALAQKNKIFKDFLIQYQLKPEDLKEVSNWIDYLEEEFLEAKKFWKWENLIKKGTIAREWTAGYTVLLDQYSFDVTRAMRYQSFRRIFAHEKEVKMMEAILASPEKNDVLLIGETGTGRRSMIEFLANDLALGKSLPQLNFKRVVYLDLPKIISETESTEEAEKIVDQIFREVAFAGNVILVIDNLHNYVSVETERKLGVVEISGILSSYLSLPNFCCIGITTYEGLHKNLEQRPVLLDYFEKIEVKEVSEEETLKILEDRALRLEAKYKVFFTFPAIKGIVSLCSKYLPAIPFPEKAIDVIDELAVLASQRKEKVVFLEDVEKVVERKAKVPIGEIKEAERRKLLNLENLIHQRIIDQEEAVKEISEALRRARSEITVRRGPIGSFLFLGPTGVGKTETAKALAEIYFGSEEKMIRLDMSEFQNLSDIPRLLGGPGEEGLLTTPVRERPFSLLLLDEFEKAHPKILNLFLQVFDEGYLTDGMGRKVSFKNTIIIATSNAGAEIIWEELRKKQKLEIIKEELLSYLIQNKIFSPELLNRFDGVIIFKPLEKENLLKIAELLLKKIQKQLKEKEIDFVITEPLKEKIVELSYDPKFGAREMQRVIQEKVGNALAKAILLDRIKRGNRVAIDPQNFEVKVNP
jgi:ATP-dependent Clp protease ATP-binding subunit ClpC